MKVQHILFEFIEAEPIWEYRLDIRDTHLLKSLEIKGVLSPFILVQQKNKFCLIDGFKRYRFFRNRTVSTIPAMLYSEENVEDAFFHGIILNETQRPLSVIEKSQVAKILHQFEKEEYRDKIYDFLGIPNKKRFTQKYLHINKLPHYAKKYFHEFQFSLRQIERILPSSISKLKEWIKLSYSLRLKAQEFVNLVEILSDISLRENVSVDILYHEFKISEFLDTDWTIQQKASHLKRHLHQIRYPLLSRIHKNVEEHITKLKKATTLPMEIHWDKTLERPGYSLLFYLEHKEKIKELQELILNRRFEKDLEKLFKILINSLEEIDEAP